jgi:hypothetical protein
LNSFCWNEEAKEEGQMYHKQVHHSFFNTYKPHNGYLNRFKEIGNFSSLIKKWFALRESDDYTYITWVASKHLFINTPFSEEVFLENVRALEVYHKVRYPRESKRQEKNTHFKDRLFELLTTIKDVTEPDSFIRLFKNESDFVKKIVTNRNYLTHYGGDDNNSDDILPTEQLYKYALKSRVILLTLLLSDIGIPAEKTFNHLSARHQW